MPFEALLGAAALARTIFAHCSAMADRTHYPVVPAEPPEDPDPLERQRVAKWIPIVVPLLALLMVVLIAVVIVGAL